MEELLTGTLFVIITFVALVLALIFPTILNVIASIYIGLKITNKPFFYIPLIILISALLSFNVRLIDLISDYFSDDLKPIFKIDRNVEVYPSEKILLKISEEKIFYRADTSVKGWGFQADWQLNLYKVPMITERPKNIIRQLGIASTSNGLHRIKINVDSKVIDGKVHVNIAIEDEKGIAATYSHIARRNIGFDDLNSSGAQVEKWRGYVSLITQRTPWNWGINYYPKSYKPLFNFFNDALSLKKNDLVSKQSSFAAIKEPKILSVITSEEIFNIEANIPELINFCNGFDNENEYIVYGSSHGVTIEWADKDYPSSQIKTKPIEGYYRWNDVSSCSGNNFLITTLLSDKALIRKFEVDSANRTAVLKEWVQVPSNYKRNSSNNESKVRTKLYIESSENGVYELLFVQYRKVRTGLRKYIPFKAERVTATVK